MKKEDILSEIKKIEIAMRRKLHSRQAGSYASAYRGSGVELEGLREYSENDDFRLIDWNSTARTGKPHTRVMQEERGLELYLIVDVSASMICGGSLDPPARNKLETAAIAAAVLGFSAADSRDRTGAILFSGRAETAIPPAGGRAHAFSIAEKILDSYPSSPGSCPEAILSSLPASFRKKGMCVIISDMEFRMPWDSLLKASSRTPPAIIRISDPYHAEAAGRYLCDSLDLDPPQPEKDSGRTAGERYGKIAVTGNFRKAKAGQRVSEIDNDCLTAARLGIPVIDISTLDNVSEKINSLFRIRLK